MRHNNLLFFNDSLDDQLRTKHSQINDAVDRIPKDQFLVSSEQELIDHVVAGLTVEAPVLYEDKTTMNQQETQVDVSGDPMRLSNPGHSGPFHIPGTQVDVDIPFTGEEWIFRYRTNPWSTNYPQAEIGRGSLRISISLSHDAERAQFKDTFERQLKLLRDHVDRAHKQVVGYNKSLPQRVQQAINNRRDRIRGCPGRCWNSAAARVRFYAICSTSVASPRPRR